MLGAYRVRAAPTTVGDAESPGEQINVQLQRSIAIFTWKDLNYMPEQVRGEDVIE